MGVGARRPGGRFLVGALMFRWISRRRKPLPVNRENRRALARLSRPDRHTVDRLTAKLRRLPLSERAAVVGQLPEWQQQIFRGKL